MENHVPQNTPPIQPLPQTSIPTKVNWKKIYLFVIFGLFIIGTVIVYIKISKNRNVIRQPTTNQTIIVPSQTVTSSQVKENWINLPGVYTVLSILEDGNIIWLGTEGGLVKVDRDNRQILKVYTMADGLINNKIVDIERSGDYLWVACQHEGISRLNLNTEQWRGYDVKSGLSDKDNLDITIFRNEIWVETFRGVNRFNSTTDKFDSYLKDIDGDTNLYSFENELWVTINWDNFDKNKNLVGLYNQQTDKWDLKKRWDIQKEDNQLFTRILTTNKGIWLVPKGISSAFGKTEDVSIDANIINKKFTAIYGIENSYWWAATYFNPYLLIRVNKNKFYTYNTQTQELQYIAQVPQLETGWAFGSLRHEGNHVWFWEKHYIYSFDIDSKLFSSLIIKDFPGGFEKIVGVSSDNKYLIGVKQGEFVLFEPSTEKINILSGLYRQLNASQYAILQSIYDKNNETLYILQIPASGEGQTNVSKISRYDITTRVLTDLNVPRSFNNIPIYLHEECRLIDQTFNGLLYVIAKVMPGIDNDLVLIYDTKKNTWEILDLKTNIYDLKPYINKEVWLSTTKGVGQLINKELVFIEPTQKDNIYNNYITGELEVGSDYIWLVADNLYAYHRKNKQWSIIKNIPPELGIIRDCQFSFDTLWVGTSNGLAELNVVNNTWKMHLTENAIMDNYIKKVYLIDDKPWVIFNSGISGFR